VPDQSRAQLAAYVLAAVLAVVVGLKLLSPDRGGGQGAEAVRVERDPAGRGTAGRLYVHVAGAVRRPGLYRLAEGSRVAAALERAGGPTRRADLASVNLAARVEDGQQIVVPRPGTRPASGGASGSGDGRTKISLASATVEQLDQLDGIGPTLAKRIAEYRDEHGGFRSVDELKQVEGIGEKRFASLREAVAP
jgi:competence protein ComEA